MAAILEDMFACPIINEALSEITQETTISALSGYNTEQTEYKAPGGVINAMISIFLSDTIGIGVTEDGQIYTEVRGNERENVVGILYHPKTKLVQACQFNPEDVSSKQAFIKPQTNRIPFQIAIPFMVHQRIVDKFKDLETAWNSLISGKDGEYFPKIPDADYAHCIIDAFVSAVESDYPVQLGKIENLALTPSKVYDYTPILLNGNEGTFRLTKSVPKPDDEDPFATGEARSFQKQMEDLREEMFPLVKEYYDALSDEDKALVPDEEKLGIYIPTKKFINIVRILADGIKRGEKDTQNVLLKGPPGCGKSTMAVAIAYVFSMPYRFTQSYKTADASEYIGTTVAENGVLKTNVATQFAQTVLRGGVHMDDDNNYAAEGEGTVKNSILIAPYTLKLADGTMAKRHPFSIFMMSANPDAKGSRPINEAYKDRFCAIIDLEKLSQNDMVRMVRERSHYEDEGMLLRMVEVWETINRDISESGEEADMLSPRSLVNWAKQTRIIGDPIEAAEYNLLGALCAGEEYKDNVLNNIIRPRLGKGRKA